MYLVTFDIEEERDNVKYYFIPEEEEEAFFEEASKLIESLRSKLRTSSMDVLVGAAVKQLYNKYKYGIEKVTRAKAKENNGQLWIDMITKPELGVRLIPAAFNKSIKTPTGWLITGDDEK